MLGEHVYRNRRLCESEPWLSHKVNAEILKERSDYKNPSVVSLKATRTCTG